MNIEEYMKFSLEKRKLHINLTLPCILKNGRDTKLNRKQLVHLLNIEDFPSGRILVCHACNNSNCINVNHVYFGTDLENIVLDGKKFNTFKDVWQRTVEKYTSEEISDIHSRGDKSKGGKANKGKLKSEEHRKKISEAIKKWHLMKKKIK
jgi:hypothetical protein